MPVPVPLSTRTSSADREAMVVNLKVGLRKGNGVQPGFVKEVVELNGYPRPEIVEDKVVQRSEPVPSVSVPQAVDYEIPRKVLHSSIGFITLFLYTKQFLPEPIIVLLTSALVIISAADYLRLNYPPFEKLYERLLGFLMRDSEKKQINGVIWYLIGVLAVLIFYPLDVAVVSVLILSWADTAASTVGRLYGRYTPPLPSSVPLVPLTGIRLPLAKRKSTAGFVAACITGSLVVAAFWGLAVSLRGMENVESENGRLSYAPGSLSELAIVAGGAGFATGIIEALDLGSLDDNLTLPILSGAVVWLLTWVAQVLS